MAHFSLLTLNCFGAGAPLTNRRLTTLAHILNQENFNVVCLQEVQAHSYRRLLSEATANSYPFRAFAPFTHAPKGGLLTLARRPIQQQSFSLYRTRQIVNIPALMDWILHKGILLTQLTIDQQPIIILNTHLNANYNGDWSPANRYAMVEQQQLEQLAELVNAQPPETLVVVCGDFNIPRESRLYHDFLAASGMSDPLAGDTRPTYRNLPGIPARFALPIDFALIRLPPGRAFQVKSDLRFGEQVPFIGGWQGYLSDHTGIDLQITWDTPSSTTSPL